MPITICHYTYHHTIIPVLMPVPMLLYLSPYLFHIFSIPVTTPATISVHICHFTHHHTCPIPVSERSSYHCITTPNTTIPIPASHYRWADR